MFELKEKFLNFIDNSSIKIFLMRLILLAAALIYILYGLFLKNGSHTGLDILSNTERYISASILIIFFVLSFLNDYIKKNLLKICLYAGLIATLHTIVSAHINGYPQNSANSIIVVIIFINLFFYNTDSIFIYDLTVFIMITLSVLTVNNMEINKNYYLPLIYSIIITSYLITLIRRRQYKKIMEQQNDLKKITRRYKTIYDNIQNSIFLINVDEDNNFRYEDTNLNHENNTGISTTTLKGKTPVELFGEEIGGKIEENYKKCLERKETISYEEKLHLKTGETIWLTKLSPIIVNGEIEQIVGTSLNITDRKKMENQLRNSEERLETLLTEMPAIIYSFIVKNDNIKFNYVNGNIEELLGYKSEDLFKDTKLWLNNIHPEDRDIFMDRIFNKKETNSIEYRLKDKDGNYHWLHDRHKIIPENENSFEIVGALWDNTKHKMAEKKLIESQKKFKSYIENAPYGIIVTDETGDFVEVNNEACEMSGYSRDELIGMNIIDMIEEREGLQGIDYFEKILDKDKKEGEAYIRLKNGTRKIWDISAVKISESRILGFVNDITERKKRQEKIKRLSFKDQLTDLYNRRFFENSIDRFNNSRRLPISIIVGDIDKLKEINDNYGHQRGDIYIKKAAEIISDIMRKEDITARIGGDEFAIILPGTDSHISSEIINRIQKGIKKFNDTKQLPTDLSISLGAASMVEKSQDLNYIFDQADKNMYQNKEQKSDSKSLR